MTGSGSRLHPAPPVVTGARTELSASSTVEGETSLQIKCPTCGVASQVLPFFAYCVPCGTSVPILAPWELSRGTK